MFCGSLSPFPQRGGDGLGRSHVLVLGLCAVDYVSSPLSDVLAARCFRVLCTKQRTLEELDYIFAVPTRTFIRYNFGTWLPWWFKRYIKRDKAAQLTPLYQFDKGVFGVKQPPVDVGEVNGYSSSTHGDAEKM
ncbi:hypothetical protein LTR53_000077 [Teratosphaeriaceae sp. CCFEE 6253]|nr:hypothetical protein LTR53_000077 [Teratosphaeriaceae sp. CCFEE 6253]